MIKFFNTLKKLSSGPFLVHFLNFWGKNFFWKIQICLAQIHTTSYGFLAPYQNFEKTKDTILRKWPDRRKEGRTDPIL